VVARNRFFVIGSLVGLLVFVAAGAANAIPSLQLGPGLGTEEDWTYVNGADGTWVTDSNPFKLLATANASKDLGGQGGYAWRDSGSPQWAYLVVSAVPGLDSDPFGITIFNDDGAITVKTSGSELPLSGFPPHGPFPTYFEIYEFQFDVGDGVKDIFDTQPGELGSGRGFVETFDITVDFMADSVEGLHFDLFTIKDLGQLTDSSQVNRVAPFSHDAQFVPEPGAIVVFSVGLLIAGGALRRGRRD
jgi:hypothetical protein